MVNESKLCLSEEEEKMVHLGLVHLYTELFSKPAFVYFSADCFFNYYISQQDYKPKWTSIIPLAQSKFVLMPAILRLNNNYKILHLLMID